MEEDSQSICSHEKTQPELTDFESRRLKEKSDTTASNQLELFKSGQWSDFTIICQQETFNVHRTLILGHSKFFDSVINDTFKEGIERKLDLSNEDPAILSMVLWFIYTGQLDYENERYCLHNFRPKDDHGNFLKLLIDVARLTDFLLMSECFKAVRYRFQLEVSNIVKETDKTRSISSYNRLLECVSFAFAPDQDVSNNMIEIQKILAWALVTGNTKREHEKEPSLSDSVLDTHNEYYPTLGMRLYQLIKEMKSDDPDCDSCGERCFGGREPRWARVLSRDPTISSKWISCICSFRGLCSVDCFAPDRQFCLLNTGCGMCKTILCEECGHSCDYDRELGCTCAHGFNFKQRVLYQERSCDDSPHYFKIEPSNRRESD